MTKGKRLLDIVFDESVDLFYEDSRAMKLTKYIMAERCLQVEMAKIFQDHTEGDWDTLSNILQGGFKGFANMDCSELIQEYESMEDIWYQKVADKELQFEPYEEDPIHEPNRIKAKANRRTSSYCPRNGIG